VGEDDDTVVYCYYDSDNCAAGGIDGVDAAGSAVGKTTAQMMKEATYVNWDFVNTWDIDEDVSYPFLIGLPNPYDPGSSDPEIVVAAAFPNGATEQFAVDITYTATPSSGEDVSEVYYSVNGGTEEYIYLRGGSGISARGTLGAGRVFLKPGVNNIVFTVKDTAGKTGTYAVANTPDSYWGYDPPPIDPQYIEQSPTFSKNRYVTNRLIIDGTLEATETEILNVISSINGTVIGKVNLTKTYMIEIPVNNEAGLQAICDGLMTNYPDIVRLATLDVMRDYVLPGDKDTGGSEQGSETDKHKQETAKAPKAGSFFFRGYNSGGVGGGIFKTQEELNGLNRQIIAGTGTKYTEDPWWEEQDAQTGKYAQWGLEAIKVPQAWIGYSSFFRGVNIGIVDGGIRETHEDLKDDTGNQIPAENIVDFGQSDKKHGTRVMGVISAEHGNGKGLAGVIDASRNSLYAYDCFGSGTTDYRITNGLIWNVQHGAKVVNFSVLVDYEVEAGDTNPRYSSTMDYLLSLGYDFVVVQAAGNEEIDAANVGAFSFVTEPELRKRIITVGAANEDGGMWRQNGLPIQGSNYGSIVDLVAPGVRIYSTEANSNDDYGFGGGTSIAAPHVTGVAAMVWSANPGLTGKQVKKIIKDSADTANPIIDNRAGVPAGTYYLIDAQAAVSMAVNETQALEEGTLIGTVVESNINETPIANAIVELYSVSSGLLIDTALTGLGGGYVMDDIEPGQYIIEVSKEGFIKKSFSMQINAGVNVYIHRISAITGTGWFYNLVAENSPDLAHIICMAEEIKNGTGYGSNGRFLALVGAPDPGATPIYTAQDLDDVRNDLTGSYVLMNNIDLSGWGEWDPIGDYFDPFTGTFDGQGHTINDLTITAFDYSAYTYGFAGLFGYMDNGNIKNVGMADTMIDLYYYPTTNPTGKYFAGAVCGGGGGEISNCYNTGSVYSNSAAAGITAGGLDESAAIRDCYNTGPASARLGVQAGICAYPSVMDISNCVNTGNISGVGYAGGIVSGCGSWTYISNCYNTGSITAAGPYAGGIVGHNMSGDSVTDCYNAGDISSGGYTGGIVGKAAITGGRTITKCYNSGSVYSYSTLIGSAGTDGAYSGGICGHVTYGEVRGCYNIGDITSEGAHTFAGGVSGFGDIGRISSCHNFGKIFSNSASYHAYAGGIIGCFGAGTSTVKDITGCHNEGPVIAGSCYNFAGGICGYIGGNFPSGLRTVNDCYNTGDITADYGTSYVGGISGYMANFNNIIYAPQINNCYNIGKLIASGLAGGISGSGNGYTEINNCAALGDEINAPTYSSYMIGYGVSKKTNNLAIDGVIIGNPINDATARITQQQAKQQATYETLGWDFNTVWEINNGYPTLQPVVGSRSVSVIDNNDFTDRAPNNLRDWILETERLTNTFLEDVSGIAQR
jgi:subtilisin family serine protease